MSSKDTFMNLDEALGIKLSDTEGKTHDIQSPPPNNFPISREVVKTTAVFVEGSTGKTEQDETDDFNYARKSLRVALEKAQELMLLAMSEARVTYQPDAFDSVSKSLKVMSGITKDVLELHEKAIGLEERKKRLAHLDEDHDATKPGSSEHPIITQQKTTLEVLKEMKQKEIIDGEYKPIDTDETSHS
ncbi:MAG TPA: hypothetical protein VIJ14_10080 [Rhabdochlamydiaceae bacterium]